MRLRKVRMPLANPSLIALATDQRGLRHRLLPLRDCFGATSAPCSYRIPDDSIAPLALRAAYASSFDARVPWWFARSSIRQVYFLPFSFSFVIALLNSVVSR